ncbi:MFS transporter [Alphaproteobacteria bacterium]|nr:MFS transporter [Alphaproteobacteria bacterium]
MKWINNTLPETNSQKVIFIFLPFACGYFLSYLYRSTNAVLAPYLSNDLNLNAEQLGLITSAYFLTFGLFQLPLGVLLDKFGARKVQSILFLIAATGAILFSLGNDVWSLVTARGLIGLGVSGALMAAFKAFAVWFPKERLPLLIGLFMSAGGMGAIVASTPLEMAMQVTDWRGVYLFLGVATIVVGLLIFFVVPEKREDSNNEKPLPVLKVLKNIYTSYAFWRIGPLSGIAGGTGLAILGLWAGPWLSDIGKFNKNEIANILFISTIMMTIGTTSLGIITDYLRKFHVSPVGVMGGALFVFIIPLTIITFGIMPKAIWPWVVLSITSLAATLAYAGLSQHFPTSYAARASTAINLICFLMAFIAQYAIGFIMQVVEPGKQSGYSIKAYQAGFGLFLGILIICYIIFIIMSVLEIRKNKGNSSKDNNV